ncbi:MAG: beta-galactosidase [Clostridia bacterium]|nr:beta-galactosidase [Clostridia bacterium]
MKVEIKNNSIIINGKSEIILMASLFYFRLPKSVWKQRLEDLKKSGYNTIDVYFPWNFHELSPGEFCFSEERNVSEFLSLAKEVGLFVIARPGPYICSEWDGGGIPAWVLNSNCNIRTNDKEFLNQVEKWYAQILPKIAEYQIHRGGSVIMMQLENELDFFDCSDVNGYISSLRDIAKKHGIEVPLFCCSGQGGLIESGGAVDGVLPTYNFYPSLSDKCFDGMSKEYATMLAKNKIPLMVSETGREHSLLRRELISGAKMVGAYNQVSGSNFEYYQSVNNWGNPKAPIVTEYDFGGIISTLGDFSREVDEAIVFSKFLKEFGEKLAASTIGNLEYFVKGEIDLPYANNSLLLKEGGHLIAATNCGNESGSCVITVEGYSFKVDLEGFETRLLPVNVNFGGVEVVYSNYEICGVENELVFVGQGDANILIKTDNQEFTVCKSGIYGGVKVKLLTKKEFVKECKQKINFETPYKDERIEIPINKSIIGSFENNEPFVKAGKDLSFVANGIYYGGAEYLIETCGKKLFVENANDFMSVYADGKFKGTGFYGGDDLILSNAQKYLLRVEKWGNSNFDDPRMRSLRLTGKRGINSLHTIEKQEEHELFKFDYYKEWLPEKLNFEKNENRARQRLNAWNSTRTPLIALYYKDMDFSFESESVYCYLQGKDAEVALYVDKQLSGVFNYSTEAINITDFVKDKGVHEVAFLVRKREWTQKAGKCTILYLNSASVMMRRFGKEQMINSKPINEKEYGCSINIPAGEIKVVQVALSSVPNEDLMVKVTGSDYKLTAISDGRVVARMIAPGYLGIQQHGGSATEFYLPLSFRLENRLKLITESVGENCTVNLSILKKNN